VALFTIQNEFRYEIVRKIFEGGMGIVYEAEQHGSREFVKRVAIKIIRPNYASQKMFIENFVGEAKLVADLIHTNIVQTYQLGEANGVAFIAMELIRGVNLEQFTHQLADKRKTLPKELAVFITSRVARGLAYAHAKTDKNGKPLGIVHRDVSFKNILIAFEGDVKLTDFGIAKAKGFLTDQEGEVVAGKPDYMSPNRRIFKSPTNVPTCFPSAWCWRTCCSAEICSRARPPRNRGTGFSTSPSPTSVRSTRALTTS
jgi:serine/threonine-protein kinase